jgi:predicted carbohydrate-binding protein with CBM5 and CBM33 domain
MGTPTALLFISTFLLMTIGTVDAHGYLMSPRSRNFLAHSSQDGVGWGGTAADPKVDYEVRFFLACYFLDNALSVVFIHK